MTAQHLLTSALEVSVTLSIGYIALALAAFISRIDTSAPVYESHPESQQAPSYQGMKVAELRAIALVMA
jgi:hypothetical protein